MFELRFRSCSAEMSRSLLSTWDPATAKSHLSLIPSKRNPEQDSCVPARCTSAINRRRQDGHSVASIHHSRYRDCTSSRSLHSGTASRCNQQPKQLILLYSCLAPSDADRRRSYRTSTKRAVCPPRGQRSFVRPFSIQQCPSASSKQYRSARWREDKRRSTA